jgi:hypothetical protein
MTFSIAASDATGDQNLTVFRLGAKPSGEVASRAGDDGFALAAQLSFISSHAAPSSER